MPAGKAQGEARDYQVYCKGILQALDRQAKLEPFKDDGIDVAINGEMDTTITFDIMLCDGKDKIQVAECRKRTEAVKQNDLFAFAYEVERLREQTGKTVAGVFFTISRFQEGAVKHAALSGIDAVVCEVGQTLSNFCVSYKKYDAERKRLIQKVCAHLTASTGSAASVSAVIIRADGTVEDLGNLSTR